MIYTYAYPRPALTVDIIVIKGSEDILLIKRKNNPFKNKWAFPGGFIDIDEDIEVAAYRELKEETSINDIKLEQFRTFGKPDRDPRGRTISIIYFGDLLKHNQRIEANDDAASLKWFSLNNLPEMAFDHNEIIQSFIESKKI